MNLLEETKTYINQTGHTEDDIIFIGSEQSGHECTWEEFCELANVDYDEGFGAAKVAQDLIVVFSDGQKMWREEYDGSEWWEHAKPFKRPENALPITKLTVDGTQLVGWCTIDELNKTTNAQDNLQTTADSET